MSEALIVANDEALVLARELAERRGTSVDTAVIEALRGSLAQVTPEKQSVLNPVDLVPLEEMTSEQRDRYERLRALSERYAVYRRPGATSDHSEFYDEHGLPT